MTSGVPTPPEGELQRPLCSTNEQFKSYKYWFEHIGFESEGGIYDELGCMPKCTRNKYDVREVSNLVALHNFENTRKNVILQVFDILGRCR